MSDHIRDNLYDAVEMYLEDIGAQPLHLGDIAIKKKDDNTLTLCIDFSDSQTEETFKKLGEKE